MKKFRFLCAAALVCLLPGVALATDATALIASNPLDAASAAEPGGAVAALADFGTVEEVAADYVTVKLDDGAAVARVQLNITDESAVLDNATGKPVKLADIKVGSRVYAYYSERMTRSIPAQSALYLLLTNVDDTTPAFYWTVEEVAHSNSSNKRLTVNNGDLVITVNTDENITPGSTVAVWYDVVMPSLPAQATASRVVPLISVDRSEAVEDAVEEGVPVDTPTSDPKWVTVNGERLHVVVERLNGQAMIPLRAVAEALGFTLTWNPNEMSAHITNGTVQTKVAMGDATYYMQTAIPGALGLTGPQDLGAPVYLRNNERMFVPANLFKLLGFDVEIGEQITINSK